MMSNLSYSPTSRMANGAPTLNCSNKNDSFTVEESETGNGVLTYPIGLLTLDEIILAGGQKAVNSDYYLYTGQGWWTMSSGYFLGSSSKASNFQVSNNGSLSSSNIDNTQGVRPSVSLASSVKVLAGGDGTSTNPYEFVVE